MDLSKILVSQTPTERTVKFSDGTEAKMHFIVPAAADVRRWHEAERGDEETRIYGMQRLIAASLYDPAKKKLALAGDQYKGLTYEGCNVLLPHVLEIAGVTTEKKDSAASETSDSATS